MKKFLSVLLAAGMVLAIAGCSEESSNSGGNGSSPSGENKNVSQNVGDGYNIIEPDIKLGMKRDKLSDDKIIEGAGIGDLVFGQLVEFEGISFAPAYNWLGTEGESLRMIEYSAASVSDEQYNKVLELMKGKYGNEPSVIQDSHLDEPSSSPDSTASDEPSASPEVSAGATEEAPPESKFQPLQWQDNDILISLLHVDGGIMIRFIDNKTE